MARSRPHTPPQRSCVFIMSQGSPRVQPWTAYCQLLCIHTLAKSAFVTPLSSTLTRPSRKSIKTHDFNSFRIRSYSTPLRNKLIRNNLTKHGGRGEGGPLHHQPPLPPLPPPVTNSLLTVYHEPSIARRKVMLDFARMKRSNPITDETLAWGFLIEQIVVAVALILSVCWIFFSK